MDNLFPSSSEDESSFPFGLMDLNDIGDLKVIPELGSPLAFSPMQSGLPSLPGAPPGFLSGPVLTGLPPAAAAAPLPFPPAPLAHSLSAGKQLEQAVALIPPTDPMLKHRLQFEFKESGVKPGVMGVYAKIGLSANLNLTVFTGRRRSAEELKKMYRKEEVARFWVQIRKSDRFIDATIPDDCGFARFVQLEPLPRSAAAQRNCNVVFHVDEHDNVWLRSKTAIPVGTELVLDPCENMQESALSRGATAKNSARSLVTADRDANPINTRGREHARTMRATRQDNKMPTALFEHEEERKESGPRRKKKKRKTITHYGGRSVRNLEKEKSRRKSREGAGRRRGGNWEDTNEYLFVKFLADNPDEVFTATQIADAVEDKIVSTQNVRNNRIVANTLRQYSKKQRLKEGQPKIRRIVLNQRKGTYFTRNVDKGTPGWSLIPDESLQRYWDKDYIAGEKN